MEPCRGFWLSVLMLCPMTVPAAARDPIVVIVNNSNALEDISSGELNRIYRGQIEQWKNGQSIVVINRPVDSAIRKVFYRTIMKSKPAAKFFRPGSPVPFKTMHAKSALSLRRFVSRIPNAIGYMHLSKVDDSVKVLKINGWAPDEADYPLPGEATTDVVGPESSRSLRLFQDAGQNKAIAAQALRHDPLAQALSVSASALPRQL